MKKKKPEKKKDKKIKDKNKIEISRKAAITRIGLSALSVTTMVLLLNEPAKGQDSGDSPNNPPDWP